MILSCQNICKSFGEKVILQDASFHIEDREKAALIGNNGAGKTTLLRIIMHELSPDSGNVVLAKDKNIGYLAQYQDIHGHHTIYEELISTKQHIIDMENRLRSLEQEMKTTTGDALDSLMNTYTRLSHQFELENGYAYKSEIMGVLKVLALPKMISNARLKLSPEVRKHVLLSVNCFSPARISFCWMSLPTTLIWRVFPGWKLICLTIRELYLLYPMTVIFLTR